MALSGGFPTAANTAIPSARYVGLYYYCAYWRKWDKVIGVSGNVWIVQDVETGIVRQHSTPCWADRFADNPFDVSKL